MPNVGRSKLLFANAVVDVFFLFYYLCIISCIYLSVDTWCKQFTWLPFPSISFCRGPEKDDKNPIFMRNRARHFMERVIKFTLNIFWCITASARVGGSSGACTTGQCSECVSRMLIAIKYVPLNSHRGASLSIGHGFAFAEHLKIIIINVLFLSVHCAKCPIISWTGQR